MSDDQFYQEILKDAEERRPKIVNPDPVEFNTKIYAKQRRDRLADCITDYFNDEDVTPRQFYEELLAELDEAREYHQNFADRYENAKMLVLGQRDVTL